MIVDLRSDVLTKPTGAMLEAMMSATMGDDVFSEDETTLKLQERVAKMCGKEAALFTVSGTMANQLAIASQTAPHDEVILDLKSHIFQFEQGAPAIISGVQTRPVDYEDALPKLQEIEGAIRFPDIHHPISKLLCLEISHNYLGGFIPEFDDLKKVCKRARELELKIHMDGARIWNAVVATGRDIKDYTSLCDTMMFCFSKGLGAPIGSILVGSKDTIARAHYLRKGLGGGWRQPGMLAAAANFALDNNIERLAEDHERVQKIAGAVEKNPKLELARRVDTNMVFFVPKSGDLRGCSAYLNEGGVLHDWEHFNMFRLVTYLGVDDEMIEYVVDQLSSY